MSSNLAPQLILEICSSGGNQASITCPQHLRNSLHDRGGLMVWAGIILDALTDLRDFDRGSVVAAKYRNEILDLSPRLLRSAVGLDFLFMNGNARLQMSRLVEKCMGRWIVSVRNGQQYLRTVTP
ncbi:hypothetical protein AVEN_167927-1 [Araneus ventricosus]|uniref:Uncharacterized protein n=1 Tax=Araneus ventricosus TaxID=182803 RepID=A0A4Y2FVY7_ARAVE|nr:hypothetical protein AVEN_167927-1 [Araneus ventricosus]